MTGTGFNWVGGIWNRGGGDEDTDNMVDLKVVARV
jgi:hypothetical protein